MALIQFYHPRNFIFLPLQSSSLVHYFPSYLLILPSLLPPTRTHAEKPVGPFVCSTASDLTSSVCWQRCSQARSVFLWHFRWWKAGTLTSLQLVNNTPGRDRHKSSSFEKHNYLQHTRKMGKQRETTCQTLGRQRKRGFRRSKAVQKQTRCVQINNTSLNRQTLCALLLQIHTDNCSNVHEGRS